MVDKDTEFASHHFQNYEFRNDVAFRFKEMPFLLFEGAVSSRCRTGVKEILLVKLAYSRIVGVATYGDVPVVLL